MRFFSKVFWVMRFCFPKFSEWCVFFQSFLSDAVLFSKVFWVMRFCFPKFSEWCVFSKVFWVMRFYFPTFSEWCVFFPKFSEWCVFFQSFLSDAVLFSNVFCFWVMWFCFPKASCGLFCTRWRSDVVFSQKFSKVLWCVFPCCFWWLFHPPIVMCSWAKMWKRKPRNSKSQAKARKN